MSWWDDIFGIFQGVTLDIAGLVNAVINLPIVLMGLLVQSLLILFYPVILIFNYGVTWVSYILNQFLAIFSGLITTYIILSEALQSLTNVFPSPWVALLMSIIMLRVGLRIYFFVRDIEILGNKV